MKTIQDVVMSVLNFEDAQAEVGTLDISVATHPDRRAVKIMIRNRNTNQATSRTMLESDITLARIPSKLIEDEITSMRSELVDRQFMKNTLNWG